MSDFEQVAVVNELGLNNGFTLLTFCSLFFTERSAWVRHTKFCKQNTAMLIVLLLSEN